MNDLISRSKLIEAFRKVYNGHLGMENSDSMITFKSLCRVINEHPTAYDVEKVVEELHSNSCDYEAPCKSNKVKCKACTHYVIGCNEAIDIVRKCGVSNG